MYWDEEGGGDGDGEEEGEEIDGRIFVCVFFILMFLIVPTLAFKFMLLFALWYLILVNNS